MDLEPIRASVDLVSILPQIVLTIGGVGLLLLSFSRRSAPYAPYVALAVLAVAAWAAVGLWGAERQL